MLAGTISWEELLASSQSEVTAERVGALVLACAKIEARLLSLDIPNRMRAHERTEAGVAAMLAYLFEQGDLAPSGRVARGDVFWAIRVRNCVHPPHSAPSTQDAHRAVEIFNDLDRFIVGRLEPRPVDQSAVLRAIADDHQHSDFAEQGMVFLMPTATEADAARYLFQVRLVPAVARGDRDMMIRLDLFDFERDPSSKTWPTLLKLDDVLRDFVGKGEYLDSRCRYGALRFVSKADGSSVLPACYSLRATLESQHLLSDEAAEQRLLEVARLTRKGCSQRIEVRWTKIVEAIGCENVVLDLRVGQNANLLRILPGADGQKELWVARLPFYRVRDQRNDGTVVLDRDHKGVCVRLTPQFLYNLSAGVPRIFDDAMDFATVYYAYRSLGDE